MHKKPTLATLAVGGLLNILGCTTTPQPPSLQDLLPLQPATSQTSTEVFEEKPSQEPPTETYSTIAARYSSTTQKAQQLAELLEHLQSTTKTKGPHHISITAAFEMEDDGYQYRAEIKKSRGKLLVATYTINYYTVWSHNQLGELRKQQLLQKGFPEKDFTETLYASTFHITVRKLDKVSQEYKMTFNDEVADGLCDIARLNDTHYIRKTLTQDLLQPQETPKKTLSTTDIQTMYEKILDEILAACE